MKQLEPHNKLLGGSLYIFPSATSPLPSPNLCCCSKTPTPDDLQFPLCQQPTLLAQSSITKLCFLLVRYMGVSSLRFSLQEQLHSKLELFIIITRKKRKKNKCSAAAEMRPAVPRMDSTSEKCRPGGVQLGGQSCAEQIQPDDLSTHGGSCDCNREFTNYFIKNPTMEFPANL